MTSISLNPQPAHALWRSAQIAGVALTLVLIAALLVRPADALHVLWDMTIPLLPAVFLVNPMVWRNVCPLATLNSIGGDGVGRRVPAVGTVRTAWVGGVVLLFVLVPARRFLFNTDGAALAITIVAVAALALAAGFAFARRSGFCNALCPVLPVEKLYGQAPLAEVRTARCGECTRCVAVGCIDLAGRKSVAQTVGPTRRNPGWVTTAFGAFAAAFPGFILGYFTTENGTLASAASVYLHIASYSLASYAVVAAAAWIAKVGAATALPVLGAASFMLYYWYSAPTLASAYGAGETGALAIRLGAALLLIAWQWNRSRRAARPDVALA